MDLWQKWKKTEPGRLACYVHEAEASRVFGTPDTTFDERSGHILLVVRRLYDYLQAKGIAYDSALIDFSGHHEAEQVIRQPDEIHDQGGNCLELALVFAALCQRLRLYPLIVLLEGHALAAVRLDESVERVMRTGQPAPNDPELLSQGRLRCDNAYDPAEKIVEWVRNGRLVLVDCTALARTTELNGPDGVRPFDDAVRAGQDAVLDMPLIDLVDVSFFHRHGLHRPYRPNPSPTRAVTADAVLGAAAVTAVKDALNHTNAPPVSVGRWNLAGIDSLLSALHDDERLRTTLTDMRLALRTTQFLRAWMPTIPTRGRLAAAMMECGIRSMTNRDAGLGDYIEHVALHRPITEKDAGPALVSFVASVALEAGLNVRETDFTAWAASIADLLVVNERIEWIQQRRTSTRRRLVLALRGSLTGGWPESVDAWLMDGKEVLGTEYVPCSPDEQSVESAIATLVSWARNLPGERVTRVEIAVPTPLLGRWRPEEVKVGSKLAVHHDVVVRWSGRMEPEPTAAAAADPLSEAEARWSKVEKGGLSRFVWLDRAGDPKDIADGFECGVYEGGFGLRFVPHGHDELVKTILTYTPMLLMPLGEDCSWDDVENAVRASWPGLLVAIAEAFRGRLRSLGGRAEPVPALATARLVWEDPPWLEFCRDVRPQHARLG